MGLRTFFLIVIIQVLAVSISQLSMMKSENTFHHKKNWIFQYLVVIVSVLIFGFRRKREELREALESYDNNQVEQQKNSQINEFINRLMPQHVQEILNNPQSKLSEIYEDVTIIFADICGFTSYSADRPPKDVVTMLSRLFTEFDKECDALNLYKVYTIGDCYVALGFLDKLKRSKSHEEAYRVLQFAFKMVEIVGKVRKEINFEELAMRIGIHTVG